MSYLLVFLGAGLGGCLRHLVNVLGMRLAGGESAPATFFVNVTGSFAMGLLAGWYAFRGDASQSWRLFLATGVLGGYTTFSTFSLDIALLWERGRLAATLLYAGASVALSVAALAAGIWIVRSAAI